MTHRRPHPPIVLVVCGPQAGFAGAAPTLDYYTAVRVGNGTLLPDRPSAEVTVPKSRPLADKLRQVRGAGQGQGWRRNP